jgi:hypothetical protein
MSKTCKVCNIYKVQNIVRQYVPIPKSALPGSQPVPVYGHGLHGVKFPRVKEQHPFHLFGDVPLPALPSNGLSSTGKIGEQISNPVPKSD